MEYATKLSDIIASLQEVSGGFLYSPEQGVYSNQAETIADDTALLNISLKLIKISSMLSVQFNDTGAIRVSFKDLVLFGTMIGDGQWLFLFHDPSLSPGMVKMTVQMALNIQTEEDEAYAHDTGGAALQGETAGSTALEDLLHPASELSKPLTAIQEELARHVGPVAELIMTDFVGKWATDTTPSRETLPDLITALCQEIDDEEDCNQFKDSLKSLSGEE